MRAALLLAIVAGLVGAPLAVAAPFCTPSIVARACFEVSVGTAADVDAYLVTPFDWRSVHAAAGTAGAGVGVHGAGFATNGPLDVWAGASPSGPYAGVYFCVGLPPYLPIACGDALGHAMRLASMLP